MPKNKLEVHGVKDFLKLSVDGWKEIGQDVKKGLSWMTKEKVKKQ